MGVESEGQCGLAGLAIASGAGIRCVKFGVVTEVAALTESREIVVGIVGRVVIQVGDGQDHARAAFAA